MLTPLSVAMNETQDRIDFAIIDVVYFTLQGQKQYQIIISSIFQLRISSKY